MSKLTELEKLQDFAYMKDIDIRKKTYDSNKKGSCMRKNGYAVISLNKSQIETTADETCILAEEIGHLEKGGVLPCEDYINVDYKKWLKRRNEICARRWAINKVLPFENIQEAIKNGCINNYEVAEECGVSVEFVEMALEHYQRQGVALIFNCEGDVN